MIQAEYVNETEQDLDYLTPRANHLLKQVEEYLQLEKDYEISFIYVTNERIKFLNKTYRNKDEATDVLTFPSEDEVYLGDVFISIERVKEQAPDFENSFEEEMRFMYVHGCLHALGYDHETSEEDELEMFHIQDSIIEMEKL